MVVLVLIFVSKYNDYSLILTVHLLLRGGGDEFIIKNLCLIHTVLITAKNRSRLKYNYNIKEIQISFIIIKEASDKKKSVFHSIISRLCCIQFYLTFVREKKAANNPKYIQTESKKFFYYIKS